MKQVQPLDVHNLSLESAKKVIAKQIDLAYKNNISVLYVSHGFNRGHKIKTWCLNEAVKLNHVIKVEPGDNEGISKIYIQINFNKQ